MEAITLEYGVAWQPEVSKPANYGRHSGKNALLRDGDYYF